ncbi:hypothetical protein TNCV_1365921 [Trichonephila clavipes]|nr:hypothetical protein TNCV_1365921 [Trichonephila clavipes]
MRRSSLSVVLRGSFGQYQPLTTVHNNYAPWIYSGQVFLKYRGMKIHLLVALLHDFVQTRTATAGSAITRRCRPIFDDFFQHLWPYIGNNTVNVVFQRVKRLWLIRIDS